MTGSAVSEKLRLSVSLPLETPLPTDVVYSLLGRHTLMFLSTWTSFPYCDLLPRGHHGGTTPDLAESPWDVSYGSGERTRPTWSPLPLPCREAQAREMPEVTWASEESVNSDLYRCLGWHENIRSQAGQAPRRPFPHLRKHGQPERIRSLTFGQRTAGRSLTGHFLLLLLEMLQLIQQHLGCTWSTSGSSVQSH